MSSPPTTLGQYQIIREIARSNDIVYEAYDPLMNRRVAIKELAVPQGSTPQQKEERINRFRREAQAAGTLNHANIMTVYSFGEDQGRTFMAMEFLDGCTLRNEIDTKGVIPPERAIEIAIEVLSGLEHAHSKGVIHRDIKPDNIQILSSGQIKITDFGIARLTFQPNLTMDGQVFGTPSYMSPEQVVGREIDARSDLFSVGIVLCEMLSGTKPFAGDSVVSITYAIMNKEASQPAGITYALWQVIEKALEKAPGMRYGSAAEMTRALQEAIHSTPSNQMVMDPYAQPQTPYPLSQQPQQSPYLYGQQQSAPPILQPYNPYGQQQQPYPQQQPMQIGGAAPPIVAPYQPVPYQPYQPMGMPAPGQLPIYYPPPPRQPLLKPETVVFLKKVTVTVIVLGTLFVLIIIAVNAGIGAWREYGARQEDQATLNTIVNLDPQIPVNEKIERALQARDKLKSPESRDLANRQIAVYYEQYGKQAEGASDPDSLVYAEARYKNSVDLDPNNAAYSTDLARLYAKRADDERHPDEKAKLYKQSADLYRGAATQTTETKRQSEYKLYAARCYYNYALVIANSGDESQRRDAREALYEAQSDVPPGSPEAQTINQLLQQFR